jgi:uncharacterized membrane-anchored protein YhcB (DUF1043 family)
MTTLIVALIALAVGFVAGVLLARVVVHDVRSVVAATQESFDDVAADVDHLLARIVALESPKTPPEQMN